MAERSETRVCGRSLAGVAASNPAGSMGICVVCRKYGQKAKCMTAKTLQQVQMQYRVQENTKTNAIGGEIF